MLVPFPGKCLFLPLLSKHVFSGSIILGWHLFFPFIEDPHLLKHQHQYKLLSFLDCLSTWLLLWPFLLCMFLSSCIIRWTFFICISYLGFFVIPEFEESFMCLQTHMHRRWCFLFYFLYFCLLSFQDSNSVHNLFFQTRHFALSYLQYLKYFVSLGWIWGTVFKTFFQFPLFSLQICLTYGYRYWINFNLRLLYLKFILCLIPEFFFKYTCWFCINSDLSFFY